MGDKAIIIELQEEHDYAKKPHQEQPPRKITKNVRGGQKRDYIFLKSVKSVQELDNFRFKNYCYMNSCGGLKPLPTFKYHTMPCTRGHSNKPGKQCNFELLAVCQANGTIDVYAHGEHNHPFMSEERRASIINVKELMPAENPPMIYRTPDNREWTFLRTFADYAQLQTFRRKSGCVFKGKENHHRVRLPCNRNRRRSKCEFQLLALKTTSGGYHVYTFGEHTHPAIEPTKKQQPAARGHQQKQQQMEVDSDSEEDDEDGQEENETDEEDDEEEENESEEDDDIIMIEDEDDIMELEQPQQKEKRQGPKEKTTAETPLENEVTPRVETAKEKLAKANAKIYKWMAGIEPNQIGPTLGDWDNASLLRMVEMADQEIRQYPAKFALWRPWLKVAMKKCIQIEGFASKYKDLINLMFDHAQD